MPRILLILIFLIVQLGKVLVVVKNELVTGILYFLVLAPGALIQRFRSDRQRKFMARKSSWVDIGRKEDLTS
jgi:hypothetical protein